MIELTIPFCVAPISLLTTSDTVQITVYLNSLFILLPPSNWQINTNVYILHTQHSV